MLMLEMSEGMGRGQDVRGSLLLLLSGVKVESEPGGVGGGCSSRRGCRRRGRGERAQGMGAGWSSSASTSSLPPPGKSGMESMSTL